MLQVRESWRDYRLRSGHAYKSTGLGEKESNGGGEDRVWWDPLALGG
jgi:hypothetical protein